MFHQTQHVHGMRLPQILTKVQVNGKSFKTQRNTQILRKQNTTSEHLETSEWSFMLPGQKEALQGTGSF